MDKYLYKLHMGESFQDYSWIQDFEAEFPQKVGLKMLNYADFSSFSDLFSDFWAIDHLYWNCYYFVGIQLVLRVQDFEIFNFHPWLHHFS